VYRLSRLLAPLSAVAFLAIAAPAAHAQTVSFPSKGTTVTMVDPGPTLDYVNLTVTADDLADTKVFLGGSAADVVIDADSVRSARYDDDSNAEHELSTPECSIYNTTNVYEDAVITPSGANSYTAQLPKGDVIWRDTMGVNVGVIGDDLDCQNLEDGDYDGLQLDWDDAQDISGFAWDAPAAPVVTATGGRQQVALSFPQERGTDYEVFRVLNGQTTLFARINGSADDEQYVVSRDTDEQDLTVGTEYVLYVVAHRQFYNVGELESETSDPSNTVTVSTAAYQTIQSLGGPSGSTTATSAQFSWSIANDTGDAPWCGLDLTENSGTEVSCTTSGATVAGLAVGAHTFTVYPSYGETPISYSWTVVAPPVVVPPVVTPPVTTPKNPVDLDGDGIDNNWLVGGKAAPAPATPKAKVSAGKVELKLTTAPKGATKIRVYRADGKGGYKLVKTLTAKSKTFTDKKVKAGHTYKYKTVGVNAKGQQGKASGAVTAKVKKKK
jgi:hypothetical protein